jgi:hypothetical protein
MNGLKLGLVGATLLTLLAGPAAASSVAVYTLPSSGVIPNQSCCTLGLDFTVNPGNSIIVDALGAFTNGTSTIDVGIYNLSTDSLITSAAITSGGPSSAYSFQAITPVTLGPGTYQITAYGWTSGNLEYNPDQPPYAFPPGNGPQVSFNTLNGALSQGSAYYNPSPGPGIATTFDAYTTTYAAGDFEVAPLPATWTMMLIGLAGLCFVGYRQGRKGALLAA